MTSLWMRQIRGMLRMELGKSLFSRRALPVYILAGLPVAMATMILFVSWVLGDPPTELQATGTATVFYAAIFRVFVLRFAVFFGCVITFMNLFRGEVLDRSLHYYFLVPIRRPVLLSGKFVSGWLSTTLIFILAAWATNLILFLVLGPSAAMRYLFSPTGIGHMIAYAGVVGLACLGYGAVFLFLGTLFRNPVLPGLFLFLWEGLIPFLPASLKKFSVIYYIESLCPVPITGTGIQIIADPAPVWMSVPGLLIFTAFIMWLAGRRVQRMEIDYGSD